MLKWSALRSIGNSRVVSLTIIVPVLGFFILFNDSVVRLIAVSPQVIARLFGTALDVTEQQATTFTLGHLYFLYFGLTLVGFASAIFAVFCPALIRRHGYANSYIEKESELATARTGQLIAKELLIDFNKRLKGRLIPFSDISRISTPKAGDDFASNFHWYLDHIFQEIKHEESGSYGANLNSTADMMNLLNENASEGVGLQIFIRLANNRYLKDLQRLHYQMIDASRPVARSFVAVFFFLGFALSAWPSIHTLYRITEIAGQGLWKTIH